MLYRRGKLMPLHAENRVRPDQPGNENWSQLGSVTSPVDLRRKQPALERVKRNLAQVGATTPEETLDRDPYCRAARELSQAQIQPRARDPDRG